jgi:hypothetical protein
VIPFVPSTTVVIFFTTAELRVLRREGTGLCLDFEVEGLFLAVRIAGIDIGLEDEKRVASCRLRSGAWRKFVYEGGTLVRGIQEQEEIINMLRAGGLLSRVRHSEWES